VDRRAKPDCPVETTLEVLSGKWKANILFLEFPTNSGHGVKLYAVRSYSAGETYPSDECRRRVL
jgi:hypothetical protein